MPQLHTYLSDAEANRLRAEAQSRGLTVSKLIAEKLRATGQQGWPKGFFEDVIGSWSDESIERPSQGDYETRPEF
jgi:LPS sulfotransferase NodH